MNIERSRGDTYPDVFTISTASTLLPANLTGCSLKMTLNSSSIPVDSTTQLYQLSGVISDPASGVVEFSPTAQQADVVGYFFYDIEMTDSYGSKFTITSGLYSYFQDITK